MEQKNSPAKPAKKGLSREDRLKAALKANMGRRKAQARARADQAENQAYQAGEQPGPEQKE
ncbi:hypothetical protein K3X41_10030 [Aliiroseovarius crassostreae]|uniref:Uncharacterized protein n=1 Tax=Aliiroseovarius crassostreae TaxID=154981 RepID=A0A0P7IXJ3_9RHOB|nr:MULTISPECIES: hypothetical protein [Aliiroseovarius]KPN63445.1 hypothetical protein AKJ29_12375 [Aliiroseovarius crassostreae]UWP88217.1 hypothetical protein K3J57_09870 [Aliiroseovarius crassostreae]UWP91370.1 hypothetical protein K3X13_09810 [Aliiroseovarius crassostreae]UWP94552.1 hypothetical protein K3X48_09975 [Aliiroseovarius crassostreae]UWP97694.1 hypothetical protein K3X53_09885 [Aliiroseovarius crassostreae]